MRDIYIIGSKGIPAHYGGFETFVEELVRNHESEEICYHVACMNAEKERFSYLGAECFRIKVPQIGPAKAVYYDLAAFRHCVREARRNRAEAPVIYVLACRIGPFIGFLKRRWKRLGGTLFVNPDGHEWMRAKWNGAIRRYWKLSERLMVKHADLLICDSKNIERYIREEYAKYRPQTTFIAYGTNIEAPGIGGDDSGIVQEAAGAQETTGVQEAAGMQETAGMQSGALARRDEWYRRFGLQEKEYYLVVGRFVPENNYETMIREFMKSDTSKNFVLITNVEKNKFYAQLREKTGFDRDSRIKFVGTVYDAELLAAIRRGAFAYLHGHEVGGTNPSLLEALSTTELNLLLGVGFNREVAENGALYWTKEDGSLSALLRRAENLSEAEREKISSLAKSRMREWYSWPYIVKCYETLFSKK